MRVQVFMIHLKINNNKEGVKMKGLRKILAVALLATTVMTGCGAEPISHDEFETQLSTALADQTNIKVYVTNPSSLTNGEAAEHTDDPCEMSVHLFVNADKDYIDTKSLLEMLDETVGDNKKLYGSITIYRNVKPDHADYIMNGGLPYSQWTKAGGLDNYVMSTNSFEGGKIK